MSALAQYAAEALARDAAELGARWREQAPAFAPRPPERSAVADAAGAERVVRAFAEVVRDEAGGPDAVIRSGWTFGTAAHGADLALHYMLREIDLLEAILLYACERAAESVEAPMATAADAIALARQLQRARSHFTLAAAKGFTQAYVDAQREHFRALRHDLRNPIGTIKSAVSLMSDESVPPEQRNHPRFRQMVARNATSLDSTIGRRLSDASVMGPALARQEVSLRDVARHVRRSLRDVAAERGCMVEVGEGLPTALTDAVGFELVLKSATAAALRASRPGGTVAIGPGEQNLRTAVVRITFEPDGDARPVDARDALAFAARLAETAGGRVRSEAPGVIEVEVPVEQGGRSSEE